MDIVAEVEVSDHSGVLAQVCDDAQLDLAVVGGKQCVCLTARHEGATDFAALRGAHRYVLQVRVVGTQSSSGRNCLIIGSMYQSVLRIDQRWKRVKVSRFQFGERPVVQNLLDDGMLVQEFLQNLLARGILSGLGFFGLLVDFQFLE